MPEESGLGDAGKRNKTAGSVPSGMGRGGLVGASPLRVYTRLMALAFVAAGAVSSPVLPGPYELGAVALYLTTAAGFSFVAFRPADAPTTRSVAGALGAFYLLSGATCAFTLALVGFPLEGWGFVASVVHACVGAAVFLCAWALPSGVDERPPAPR